MTERARFMAVLSIATLPVQVSDHLLITDTDN
jgi:hypothetical protein